MLRTRSPLSTGASSGFTFDLHVLSAPPAFVLSQDQTLREDWVPTDKPPAILTLSCVAQRSPLPWVRQGDEVLMYLSQGKARLEVLDTRRTFAVEFSKTGAARLTA